MLKWGSVKRLGTIILPVAESSVGLSSDQADKATVSLYGAKTKVDNCHRKTTLINKMH